MKLIWKIKYRKNKKKHTKTFSDIVVANEVAKFLTESGDFISQEWELVNDSER